MLHQTVDNIQIWSKVFIIEPTRGEPNGKIGIPKTPASLLQGELAAEGT